MAITPKDIDHLALLSRLGLSEEEKEKLAPDLARILDYVGELQKVNTKEVLPLSGGTDLLNIFREDKASPPEVSPEELLKEAPPREGHHVKVPRILE